MKTTKLLWRAAGLIGLLSTILFIGGFIYGVITVVNPQEGREPVNRTGSPGAVSGANKVQILALGDSLTKGVGDEKGEGYVGKVKALLEKRTEKPVYVWNYAVNGAVTDDLLAELDKPSMADYIRQANVILLTIGGNDLNRLAQRAPAPAQQAGNPATPEGMSLNYKAVLEQLPGTVQKLERILTRIAELNKDAKIVYVGLYHPYLDLDPRREGSEVIQEWNSQVFKIANRFPNIGVVPTYDIFQTHLTNYLFIDHFHPNGAGYQAMAERVVQVLK